jgi:hypothetical protein
MSAVVNGMIVFPLDDTKQLQGCSCIALAGVVTQHSAAAACVFVRALHPLLCVHVHKCSCVYVYALG